MDNVLKAGEDITKMLMSYYHQEHQGIHAETIICAAAALMGEWSLRSLEQPLPKEGWVVSSGVNEVMIEGKEPLLLIVEKCARELGLSDKQIPDPVEVVARTVSAFGSSYPPLTVPKENFPSEWSPAACVQFCKGVETIAEKHLLKPKEIPLACTLSITHLLMLTKDALDPEIGVKLAYEMSIATARMAPMSQADVDKLRAGAA